VSTWRGVQKAVDELHTYVSDNLATELRALEIEESLDVNALEDPERIVKARIPYDNASPLIQIYEEGWDFDSQRNSICNVACTIVISVLGDPDLVASEIKLRRYETAVVRTIIGNPTLGAKVTGAIITGGDAGEVFGDDSAIRQVKTLDLDMQIRSA